MQEYWLLLPQRLELVQYLSPAEHGVCNRQSADYGFYARASFLRLRQRFVFPEQHLVEVLPHRRSLPLHLASLLVVLSVWKVLTDGHWLEIAVEFEFLLAQHHTIPNQISFIWFIPIQVKAAFKLDVARIDADISSATSAPPADVLSR